MLLGGGRHDQPAPVCQVVHPVTTLFDSHFDLVQHAGHGAGDDDVAGQDAAGTLARDGPALLAGAVGVSGFVRGDGRYDVVDDRLRRGT